MTRHKPSARKPVVPEYTDKKTKPIKIEDHNVLPVQEINIKEKERQEAVTQCKEYIRRVVAQYFSEELMPQLLHLVEEYANGIIRCAPIMIAINDTKRLRPIDFYHLIWNLWTRLNALDRRASCRFIKNAFPIILENTNEETIYRKMNDTYVKCTIENIPKDEPLVP
ncbi:MAG: hypothetical protein SPF85_06245 [Alloprevotella sp.]|nr:hypothetical protein [Alloprevotella sp.]